MIFKSETQGGEAVGKKINPENLEGVKRNGKIKKKSAADKKKFINDIREEIDDDFFNITQGFTAFFNGGYNSGKIVI